MDIAEKIKKIRETEGLSQFNFAVEVGMNMGTLQNYEYGRRATIRSNELEKICQHPRFQKYTLWLMTGQTLPEAGQISPEIEQTRKESPLPATGTL